MSETLSETEACDLLARVFRARGYTIQRNVPFREYGVEFHIDGWDARNRIGFEFLSSEDDDHDDLSLEEYKTLNAAQQRGELSLFIIDEVEPLSAEDLTDVAEEFLDEAAKAVLARRAARLRGKKAASRKRAGKKAAVRKPVKKAAARRKKSLPRKSGRKKGSAKKNSAKKNSRRRP